MLDRQGRLCIVPGLRCRVVHWADGVEMVLSALNLHLQEALWKMVSLYALYHLPDD